MSRWLKGEVAGATRSECEPKLTPKAVRFLRAGDGEGPVTAVQDTFSGKQFRRIHGSPKCGDIMEMEFRNIVSMPIGNETMSPWNYKILAEVHPNTVRAFLRKVKVRRPLAKGKWFEVHGD